MSLHDAHSTSNANGGVQPRQCPPQRRPNYSFRKHGMPLLEEFRTESHARSAPAAAEPSVPVSLHQLPSRTSLLPAVAASSDEVRREMISLRIPQTLARQGRTTEALLITAIEFTAKNGLAITRETIQHTLMSGNERLIALMQWRSDRLGDVKLLQQAELQQAVLAIQSVFDVSRELIAPNCYVPLLREIVEVDFKSQASNLCDVNGACDGYLNLIETQAAVLNRIDQLRTTEKATWFDWSELETADLSIDYLIRGVLVRGQPAIIGGPMKALKTSIMVDMAVSLATGTRFLERFPVPRQHRVGVVSAESGGARIRDTLRRVSRARNITSGNNAGMIDLCFEIPQLADPQWQSYLAKRIRERGLEVLFLDPAYLMLLSAEQAGNASNVFLIGAVLRDLANVMLASGATPVINHHFGKGSARSAAVKGDPPELQDLSMAGFAEFARQWLLVNRRAPYEIGSGFHQLWLSVGGSAGHGFLLAADFNEGRTDGGLFGGDDGRQPQNPRIWNVTLMNKMEADRKKQEEKSEAEIQKEERVRQLIEDYLGERGPTGATKNQIYEAVREHGAKMGKDTVRGLVSRMHRDGYLCECKVRRNNRPEDGFRLASHGEQSAEIWNEEQNH
ncbi:MAG: hypothetical protein DWQ29_12855 [Planctomycetota bacterium]|nr:MAG: hypothetical protein DWQ29_12855 [Planctomycetota bacterium]